MSNAAGTLELVAIELTRVLSPLQTDLTPARARTFFAQLGIPLTEGQVTTIAAPLGTAVTKTTELITTVNDLIDAIAVPNYHTIAQKSIEAITKVGEIINGFINMANGIRALGLPEVTPQVADKIPERIFNYLFANYLDNQKGVNDVLELLGILDREDFNTDSVDTSNPPYTISTYHFDRIGGWFSSPMEQLRTLYDWGSNSFDGRKLFARIEKVVARLGLPIIYDETISPAKLDMVLLEMVPKTDTTPAGLLIKLKETLSSGLQTIQRDDFKFEFKVDFQTPTNTGLHIQPNGTIFFQPPSASSSMGGEFSMKFTGQRTSPPEPFILFGKAGSSRFEIGEFSIGAGAQLTWDGSKANGNFIFEGALRRGKIFIDTSSGDGFLAKILPGTTFNAEFDLLIGVSTERGFYFGGSSALEVRLPAHIELGPVSIEGLTIVLKFQDGKIPISIGADIKASLGPMVAVVQNIGVITNISFPEGGGNLGPMQLDIGFKPPNGVGLSIDAGVIKGGGILYLDFDKGEYFGALEFTFSNVIALKALGIINTKMPDGSKGFALLILITAEFTPIQLGFGFTLNGVGGLLAVNRTTDIDALKTGVRTGAVSSILFPQDIVANINRIISDLRTIFPIAQDHFIIAPMAKLGWGTPPLITLELGIIIDIPAPRLVILGVLRCILPDKDSAILKLQVNFAGGIDFDQGLIWFDASLFDSHLLIYTLTGDMALRIGWKNPVFILSVGGFHPSFNEIPPDLTGMRRMMISLMSGDNPRLAAMTYFAVTSNTVQSGARVELYAEACGFNIYGYLGYDLLIQFNPFHFIADIYAGLALRSGTSEIAGIRAHCQLSGPTPWHAVGDASLTILFFEISVGFDVTWGDTGPAQIPETENVLQLVKDALNDKRNWKADIPANTNLSVTLRKIELPEGEIIIHPFGVLSVSQKVVPLELSINKFGNKKPGPDTLFTLTYGGASDEVKEEFAIANFVELSDDEKLSRKSFEKMKSGLRLNPANTTVYGSKIHKDVNYELSYVSKKKGFTFKFGLFQLYTTVFENLLPGNAIGKNAYAAGKKAAANAPAKVNLPEQQYMIVNNSDLQLHAPALVAASETEAYRLYDNLVKNNPSLRHKVQVISNAELN